MFKRRKILNDVLISSFGRAVHCSIKRGILNEKDKAFKLINEWMSGLPLNNEKCLNTVQLELIVDLFIFIGKFVLSNILTQKRRSKLVFRISTLFESV
jgi:hypothetical protein